jgi:hypothetical protein
MPPPPEIVQDDLALLTSAKVHTILSDAHIFSEKGSRLGDSEPYVYNVAHGIEPGLRHVSLVSRGPYHFSGRSSPVASKAWLREIRFLVTFREAPRQPSSDSSADYSLPVHSDRSSTRIKGQLRSLAVWDGLDNDELTSLGQITELTKLRDQTICTTRTGLPLPALAELARSGELSNATSLTLSPSPRKSGHRILI